MSNNRNRSTSSMESGEIELIKAFITEVIIQPKQVLRRWSEITHQTPAFKIGYVGQHLASLITGVPGTGTGARGDDLADHTEVKSCNRVDQAGKCRNCGGRVMHYENQCSKCGSDDIERKNDSHWLFSVRSEQELRQYVEMDRVLLLLFDYPHFDDGDFSDMRIMAFEIYPNQPEGETFRSLVTNHYWNIYLPKTRNNDKANPMNLHPFQIQFYKCHPHLTFSCLIKNVDSNPQIQDVFYVAPGIARGDALDMPSDRLKNSEWSTLVETYGFERLAPYLVEPCTKEAFLKKTVKEKARLLPLIKPEMLDCVPLREIVSVTQGTRYHRS